MLRLDILQPNNAIPAVLCRGIRPLFDLWLFTGADLHTRRIQALWMVLNSNPIRVLHRIFCSGAADRKQKSTPAYSPEDLWTPGFSDPRHNGTVEFEPRLLELPNAGYFQMLQASPGPHREHSYSKEKARTPGFLSSDCNVYWAGTVHPGRFASFAEFQHSGSSYDILSAAL